MCVHVLPDGRRNRIGKGLGAFEVEYTDVPTTIVLDFRGKVRDLEVGALSRDGQNAHMETYRSRLASILEKLEAEEAAFARLEEEVEAGSEDPAVLERFAGLCAERGEASRALPCLRKLQGLGPTAERADGIGRLLLESGRIREAEQAFEALVALDPERHRESRIALMAAYRGAGEKKKAAELGRAYLRSYPEGPGRDEATWHAIVDRPTRRAVEAFLKEFPDSPRAEELRRLFGR